MTLRQFEREAARKQDEMRETQHLGSEHTKREAQKKQPKEMQADKNLLLVRLLKAEDSCEKKFCLWPPMTRICYRQQWLREDWRVSSQEFAQQLDKTPLLPGSIERRAALREQKSNYLQAVSGVLTPHASDTYFKSQQLRRHDWSDQWPVCILSERLLSVLEELHSLSAAVVNSSEDSAEEEGQNDSVGPSTGSSHSWYLTMIHGSHEHTFNLYKRWAVLLL